MQHFWYLKQRLRNFNYWFMLLCNEFYLLWENVKKLGDAIELIFVESISLSFGYNCYILNSKKKHSKH